MFYKIKQFFRCIYNVITWFPIIWGDQQWDQHYFYKILRKKLERMEKFFRSSRAYSIDAEKEADNIHYCIERLDRLIEEDYLSVSLKEFEKVFPDYKWEMDFQPCKDNPKLYEWIDHDTPEQTELHKKCYTQADLDEQDDLDELFAQIRLHLEEWWD